MLVTFRSANLSYGTDAVAHDLQRVLRAPSIGRNERPELPATASDGPSAALDLAALYPGLYAAHRNVAVLTRSARAAAFRLSILGTAAAAMLVLFHR